MPTLPSATPAPLDRVQGALPRSLREIPVQALLAGGGLFLAGLMVVVSALARSDKTVEALEEDAPPALVGGGATGSASTSATAAVAKAPSSASGAEVDAARLAGASALAALAQRYPEDPRLLEALCTAQAREKKEYAAALRTLRHLFEIAPERRGDAEVREVLVETAGGPPEVASEAFEIMKTRMGSAGADALYEVREGATDKAAKDHATAALADPEVMRSESKALLVAEELRRTLPCGRKTLLARASADGDGRSLTYLRPLVSAKSCGGGGGLASLFRMSECHACFTAADRATIGAAIAAIEKREKH